MTTTYPMKCRYGEECGDFSNGVALRRHYDDNHPEYVPTTKRGSCSACGLSISRSSFAGHVRTMHGRTNGVQFILEGEALPVHRAPAGQTNVSGWCTICGASIIRKNTARHVIDTHGIALEYGQGVNYWTAERPTTNVVPMHAVSDEAVAALSYARHPSVHQPPDSHLSDELPQLTLDQIVLPAIEVMALPTGMVPVSALAALFLWRDQTAAMLSAVTGGHQ